MTSFSTHLLQHPPSAPQCLAEFCSSLARPAQQARGRVIMPALNSQVGFAPEGSRKGQSFMYGLCHLFATSLLDVPASGCNTHALPPSQVTARSHDVAGLAHVHRTLLLTPIVCCVWCVVVAHCLPFSRGGARITTALLTRRRQVEVSEPRTAQVGWCFSWGAGITGVGQQAS
jgi:hypothetical protein